MIDPATGATIESWPGWEDSAVPPERLADYLAEFTAEFTSVASREVIDRDTLRRTVEDVVEGLRDGPGEHDGPGHERGAEDDREEGEEQPELVGAQVP